MCYAHPKIDQETVRVRFMGYGASSLDIDFRIYALTREWGEFYAIREDIFLRVNDIVANSGTSFAFPSQTLYMGRDDGLDDERSNAAREKVESWRRNGNLPYPSPTEEKIESLANTLDFPPRGTPGARDPEAQTYEASEPLSADEESQGTEDEEPTVRAK